jgi:Predicted 3'-5' exonuclease related to the exonuclease domain of PolB
MDGGRVEEVILGNQIDEVARYCESDVLNNYPVWLMCSFSAARSTLRSAVGAKGKSETTLLPVGPLTLTYLLRSAFQKALGCYFPCPARTESN